MLDRMVRPDFRSIPSSINTLQKCIASLNRCQCRYSPKFVFKHFEYAYQLSKPFDSYFKHWGRMVRVIIFLEQTYPCERDKKFLVIFITCVLSYLPIAAE